MRCDSTGNRNAASFPVSFGSLAVVASGVGFVFGFVFVLVLGLVLEFEFDVELGFVFGFVLDVKEENRRTSLVQGRGDNGEEIKSFQRLDIRGREKVFRY